MRDERMKAVEDELTKLFGSWDRCSNHFQTLAVLLAAVLVGPDIDELASVTGYVREFIADISRRMRASRLWENGVVHSEDIKDNYTWNMLGLSMHQLVAEGEFVAHQGEDGNFGYRSLKPRPIGHAYLELVPGID